MTTLFDNLWPKFASSKRYREQFALSFLKRAVPLQIKTLRKKHCGSQAVLAERSGLTQGVVSRAEDPEYGNLTFNTVGRIAAGLDMAFIGMFVPFSRLVKFVQELSEEGLEAIPTFVEESGPNNTNAITGGGVRTNELASSDQRKPPARVYQMPPPTGLDLHNQVPAR